MSDFMQRQVTNKRKWVALDGDSGTTFVDAEDVPAIPNFDAEEHLEEMYGDDEETDEE